MLPDLPVLFALVIGLWRLESVVEGDTVDSMFALGGTAAATLVVVALCRMASDRALKAIEEQGTDGVGAAGLELSLVPLFGWFAAIFIFDWATFTGTFVPQGWPILPYVLLFLPLAVMFGAAWLSAGRVEARILPAAAAKGSKPIRRGLKRNALVLVPLAVLLVLQEGMDFLARLDVAGVRRFRALQDAFPDIGALLMLGVVTAVTWFAPALAKRILKAQSLPAGPLRTDIERLLSGIGVRCKDVLLWKTGDRVVNAMVVGLSGGTRYVFVTDGLISMLPPSEVVAVVAHEAGHAKKRHLPTYFVVSLALLLLMRAAEEAFVPSIGESGQLFLTVLFLALFWFGMLGWLSRKFERQADAFGADHGGDLEPGAPPVSVPGVPFLVPHGAGLMMSALQRIYLRVGPGGRHLRHGAPPERIAFLARYSTDPRVREQFQASMRAVKTGLWLFVVAALATTLLRLPGGLVRGEANLALLEGSEIVDRAQAKEGQERPEEARAEYERARRRFVDAAAVLAQRPDDPMLRHIAAVAEFAAADTDLHHLGKPDEAKKGFARVLDLVDDPQSRRSARLTFEAHVDLGRLSLRDPDLRVALLDALSHRKKADEISDESFSGDWRKARLRLLDSAIGLRDPATAATARRDLEQQAHSKREGADWDELRRDAAEELALAPPAR